jgi:ATPase subunit of ABC transporter with duplicated ATPase domains
MNEAPLIRVTGLEAGYERPVVGPVSFTVTTGEVFGLVGPNGSGKSTILKAIANHVRVFDGDIEIRPDLKVAWMDQQPVRLPEMPFSAREYLHYAEASREDPPAHLASWMDRRVDSLSGGQFQLLGCWTVLGSRAELLLLDEPTNNLDNESEQALIDILSQKHDRRGVLLVSHDRDFLTQVCDRVLEVGK